VRPATSSIARVTWLLALLLAICVVNCSKREALLDVSTREIDFGSELDSVTITVMNAGADRALTSGVTTLEYRITPNVEWLTVSPSTGACGEGQENAHVVAVDRNLLLVGQNLATLDIVSNGGSRSIEVRAVRDAAVCSDPPTEPWNPTPGDDAASVSIYAHLIWSDGTSQCPGLTATYDVYFGTTSPPPLDHNNGTSKQWDPGTLAFATTYYWRIVAKDANGSTTGAEWSFATAPVSCTTRPTAPSGPNPADNATAVSIDQDLTWSGGVSQCNGLAATYDVYFGTTSPPPLHHDNGTSKTWDPGTLAYATTYYWRIVAKDANGSTMGGAWNFTTAPVPCTTAPTAPSSPTPSDDAASVSIYAHLIWSGGTSQCPGLTANYDVYFGTTSPPPLHHNNGTSKTWDPGTLLSATTYYWRIVAKDANGSTTGAEWNFATAPGPCIAAPTAPSGPVPADDATAVSIDQNVTWAGGVSQCSGLTATYDVYFGTTSPPPLNHNNGSSKTWDPGTLLNATTYYWRIVAKDANGSTTGAEWSFTTAPAPCTAAPTAPSGPVPVDDAIVVSIDQNVSWAGGVSQCSGLTATYDVYFGTTSPPPLDHNNGTSKSWDPGTLLNATTYYWRIVAKDANGSTTGSEWSFTTADAACIDPPTSACDPSPVASSIDISINANVSWGCGVSVCPGLTPFYDIYFGTDPTPGFRFTTSAKTWDPGVLAYNTTYYWQIVTVDGNGTTIGPVWSFTTEEPCLTPPTAACNPNPTDGKVNASENQNLAWQCGISQCPGLVATYDVYFGTTPTLGQEHFLGNTATKAWNLPRLAFETTFYWKIVTKDANGVTPGPIWSFTTKED
jgi:hypothetical protein